MLTGPLPRQLDHRKMAEQKARLEGLVPIKAFDRLADMLSSSQGDIKVSLQFRKGKKHRVLVTGECSGEVSLICQACLEPVLLPIHATVNTLLVDSVDELLELDQEEDGVVYSDKYITLEALLEDDLILSLPMVPRHDEQNCGLVVSTSEKSKGDTWRPFAGLAGLSKDLKRS